MIGKENWYMSRRIWGALLSLVAAVLLTFYPEQSNLVAGGFALLASALGISSWTLPKGFQTGSKKSVKRKKKK